MLLPSGILALWPALQPRRRVFYTHPLAAGLKCCFGPSGAGFAVHPFPGLGLRLLSIVRWGGWCVEGWGGAAAALAQPLLGEDGVGRGSVDVQRGEDASLVRR